MSKRLTVIAHPNSKQSRVIQDEAGHWHFYLQQKAIGGQANQALIEAVADHFHLKKNQVQLISGHKSKQKVLSIE